MILNHSTPRIFVGAVVLSGILSLMIVSCSTTDQSGESNGLQIRYAGFEERVDPPGLGGDPDPSAADVENGQKLFASLGCAGCHTTDGKGGLAGPDLSDETAKGRSAHWLQTKILDPKMDDPQTIMPSYDKLSDEEVDSLVAYLLNPAAGGGQAGPAAAQAAPGRQNVPVDRLVKFTAAGGPAGTAVAPTPRGRPAASAAASLATGAKLWSQKCGQCHNLRPASEYSDAQWAVAVHHMRVRVPLTGKEQRDILAFLQASN